MDDFLGQFMLKIFDSCFIDARGTDATKGRGRLSVQWELTTVDSNRITWAKIFQLCEKC